MTGRKIDLAALMAPRNVVLVGASDRNWSPRVFENLKRFGFAGAVYPVNSGRREIFGVECYRDLASLPEAPDHLVMLLPHDQCLEMLAEGGRLGARSSSFYAAGFGEGGDARGLARAARLRAIVDEFGIAVVGPNCMGLAVGHSRFSTFPDEQMEALVAGGSLAVLTQSGMLAQTLSRGMVDGGLELAYLISLGNQTGLQFADYIEHLVGDPSVRVIACYIESVKDAGRFLAAARMARDKGKHIVAVKAGGSETARAAALAHTGSLAGSAEIFDVFAREAGVLRVDNLEDLVEAAKFFALAKPPRGRRVAVMTNSGALKSLMTEAAEKQGVEFATLAPATGDKMRAALADADVANPFDCKRTIRAEEYIGCVEALHDDPNVDMLVLAEELPREAGIARKEANLAALESFVATRATKPVFAFAPLTFHDTPYMREMRAKLPHIAWLRDLGKTFRLIGKITAPAGETAPLWTPRASMRDIIEHWRHRAAALSAPTALNEAESKQLLRDFGLPIAREVVAPDVEAAVEAAKMVGFPVVMKAVSASVPHKSDAGLVLLNICDHNAARSAADTIVERCRQIGAPLEGFIVAQQLKDGVEMVLGIGRDPEMGLALMVGMGGVWLELFKDTAFARPGLSRQMALDAIGRLRAHRLLAGYRGNGARDARALADAMVALGRLAIELGDVIEAVDVNPILVRGEGHGAFALDALIVLRPSGADSGAA